MLRFFRKKMKAILIAVAVVFAASMFYGVTATRWSGIPGSQKGLARVNGKLVDPLRYREVLNRVVRQVGEELKPQDLAFVENLALQQTIDFTLILQEARKKVRLSGREVDMAIENIIRQQNLPSKRELERALQRAGMNMGQFRGLIKDEMMVQKMIATVKGGVKVSPDDLREVRASHILVSTEAEAREILARLQKGEDFAALARKYSQDAGSAVKGGDLDFFTTGRMVEPFEKAVFSLKIGEVSGVVKSAFGCHVIKLTDSRLRKFEGEEKDLEKAALREKQEIAFRKWFSDLRGKARIEVINPELRAHSLRFQGRVWEAIEEYKKAIAMEPRNPYLHVFLGDAYGMVGKSEAAISEYQKATNVEGGNPELYIILAQAQEKAGNKDEVVKQYKRASLVAGDNKAMHERLLKTFQELKAWEQVRREKAEIARIEKKEAFEKELKGEQ